MRNDPSGTTEPPLVFPSGAQSPGQAASVEGLTPRGDVRVLRIRQSVDELDLPPSDHHLIMVNVGRPFQLEEHLDGRVVPTSGVLGAVALVPAGASTSFRSRSGRPQIVETLAIAIPPGVITRLAESAEMAASSVELIGMLGGRDPVIAQIGASLLPELDGNSPIDDLYINSLTTTLAIHLLRRHSTLSARSAEAVAKPPAHGLSRTQVAEITELIDAQLSARLTMNDLAKSAGLSPYHFARMFKRATGVSPHQFVIARRVAHAEHLLAHTDLPLAEIALRAGFADQSHLAKHTKRLLGTSPRALRRNAL